MSFSKNSLQRLAKAYGGRLVAQLALEAQAMVQIASKETEVVWRERVEPASEVMNISMDGAMVNIREEGWKEVKLVTVSAVRHRLDAETGKPVAHLSDHSYRAGLWDATEFGKQQWLYGEQGGFCNGCEHHFMMQNLTIDHIIAKAHGGTDHISNLQLLCSYCNSIKGTRSHEELLVLLTDKGWIKRKKAA